MNGLPLPEAPRGPAGADRSPWLILIAAAALTLCFYCARSDQVGVTAAGRGWHVLTGRPMSFAAQELAAGLLLGLLPVLAARGLLGMDARRLGLGLGDRRRGLRWLALGVPVALLAARLAAANPDMRAVYPLDPGLTAAAGPFLAHVLAQGVYYAGWEILFRGVLLFGLAPRLGFGNANALQTAISVIAHFGRPFPETLSAIPAGLAFGGIARHTGSMWYVMLIHWTVGAALDLSILAG